MANSYWNHTGDLIPGTLARADDVDTQLDGIAAGFDAVEDDIDGSIKVTVEPGVLTITDNAAARANKVLAFDSNGDLEVLDVGTNYFPNVSAEVQATHTQLDYTIATPGTAAANKAVVLDGSKKIDVIDATSLKINGGTVSATAAQLNYLAGVTPGTAAASKAVVLDGTSKIDTIDITTLKLGGSSVSATAAQLNYLAGVTAGTSAASKAVVLDGSSKINTIDITSLKIGGTTVTATAAKLNYNDISTLGTVQASKVVTADGSGITTGQKFKNAVFSAEYDNGNSGASKTITWANGNKQKVLMTASCIISFGAPAGPTNLVLKVTQGGTGSYTITWPGTVKWPNGGSAPTLSTAVGAIDIITLYYDGTNYYGSYGLDYQ